MTTKSFVRALDRNIASCHLCAMTFSLPGPSKMRQVVRCPRCASKVHPRFPMSLQRTWAFVLAATVCYIPANYLPILTVISFGQGAPDTILSGVVHLFAEGQWPIGLLVFVASVLVPLLKIIVITFLLISVHMGSRWRMRERSKLFHIIDFLGRWSMIDIFMISILVALVQLGAIASIEPGAGAAYFGVVVICTMLAAMSFDPRLLWDNVPMPAPTTDLPLN